jgi:hypothetical protein
MSEAKSGNHDGVENADGAPEDLTKLLTLAGAGVLVLLLILAVFSAALVYGIGDQVSLIEAQNRKLLKTVQSLDEQLTTIKATVDALSAKSPAVAAAPAVRAPVHIDAADPSSDCVIRSGDRKGLADCMGR